MSHDSCYHVIHDLLIARTMQSEKLKRTGKNVIGKGIAVFFEYYTPKIVHINNKIVGITNRLIQLVIIGYIIGWVFIHKKGYQDTEPVLSSVTTKVKGVVFTNTSIPGIKPRIWDVADYVVPPQEDGSFFVTTNIIISPQTQDQCDEDPKKGTICTSDANCTEGFKTIVSNGVQTGKCVKSTQNTSVSVCEVYAWCPVEVDVTPPVAVFGEAKDFTVLLKNNVEFPKFNEKRRNIIEGSDDKSYLNGCHYNHVTDPFCPIFKLNYIVENSEPQSYKFDDIAKQGAVFAIVVNWDCNFDPTGDPCVPQYTFRRLDKPNANIANGWNFRYAHYYSNVSRTLYKAYGVSFKILVTGTAGKFNVIPFFQNMGSGLALLALATVVCDVVVLYLVKSRKLYNDNKYLHVSEDEDDKAHLLVPSNIDYGGRNHMN